MELEEQPIVVTAPVCRQPLRYVELTRSPKKLIYAHDEPVTFTATCYTDDYERIANGPLGFDWQVDGVSVGAGHGTHTQRFSPASVFGERRRDYQVAVTIQDLAGNVVTSPPHVMRVAQQEWVGTPVIPRGQDALVQRFAAIFDDVTFAPDDAPTLEYVPSLPKGQMDSRARRGRHPIGVRVCDLAYDYPLEEFEAMLWHEALHCRQYSAGTVEGSGFHWLWSCDDSVRAGAMECPAYALYLSLHDQQGVKLCSYKFLKEYGVVSEIMTRYLQVVHTLGERRAPVHDNIREVLDLCLEHLVTAFPEIRQDDDYEELATVRRGLAQQEYWPDFR